MKRRQLNRYAVPTRGVFANSGNSIEIRLEVTLGIRRGPGGFAKHIEASGKAPIVLGLHPLHGFVDIAAHDEDLPHQPHRRAHRLAYKWFPGTCHQAL